jgi:hypothetical protein
MAHIKSSSFQDEDGIFLWQMEDKKRVRRIGGPYVSNEAADRASKIVSEAMGERPVEDYIKYLRQDYPGVVGGQSPIPETYRSPYAPPITPGLLGWSDLIRKRRGY